MTIALGLVCTDGVLVASDSMGHSGKIATRVEKARALARQPVVWAVSGSEFLTQRVEDSITKEGQQPTLKVTPSRLAEELRPVIADAYGVPTLPPGASEHERGAHAVEALILGWCDGAPSFVHVPADLAPVDCRGRNFVAIGSGHEFASVVHASLRHHGTGMLTLQHAVLLAHRIVATVCNVSSWGVALPVQIAIADRSGARVLDPQDLEEVETGVERWLASETANFLGSGRDDAATLDLPTLRQDRGAADSG